MKIKVEISVQMEDAIVKKSLKDHIGYLKNLKKNFSASHGPEEKKDVKALKRALAYYGG